MSDQKSTTTEKRDSNSSDKKCEWCIKILKITMYVFIVFFSLMTVLCLISTFFSSYGDYFFSLMPYLFFKSYENDPGIAFYISRTIIYGVFLLITVAVKLYIVDKKLVSQ